tara:strand:- start:5 stop:454 length:450 start_codon:yes stop_codon:yes gene_type:complete
MTIWVDADAAPRDVKDVLIRAAQRRKVSVTFVANQYLNLPMSAQIQMIRVGAGADVADDYIADHCESGDLVISADVPLAARVVANGGLILQPRGRLLDKQNVEEALSIRDFGDSLRSSGVETGGPPPFKPADKQKFSNALDRWLTINGF